MSSSLRNPIDPDSADRLASFLGWVAVLAWGMAVAGFGGRIDAGAAPGEMRMYPEMRLRIAPAPMPAIAVPPPEPVVEPPPEPVPEPVPLPEPESLPAEPPPAPVVESVPETVAIPPPEMEPAPAVVSQTQVAEEGEAGNPDAIRSEWLAQLRRRIEQSKFYPGAARYSRETGTVLLRVRIGPAAEIGEARILENTGSALLAEGALAILRRAAARPLGTNRLPEGFEVDVPITYRIGR